MSVGSAQLEAAKIRHRNALFMVYVRAKQLIDDVKSRHPASDGWTWKCPFMESLDAAIKDYEELGD